MTARFRHWPVGFWMARFWIVVGGLVLAAGFSIALADRAAADEKNEAPSAEAPVSYYKDIRPLFQNHCQGCHQPAKAGGEYVMTSFERLIGGGESGEPAVKPGHPQESSLIAQITPVDGKAAMPKDKPPLADSEIQLIARWIAAGALDDSPMSDRSTYDRDHPPVYQAAPVITSIDFSPDGKLLAVSAYHEVVLHRVEASPAESSARPGDASATLAGRLIGMSERIESAVFSPDGKRLAVTGGSPGRMGELQVWNVETQELQLAQSIGYDTIYGASWSPDGTKIAFGCPDKTIRAVDSQTGQQVLFNGAHEDWVLDTVFSTQGTHLISVSRDMSMKLIEVATQRFVDNITSITPGALKGGLSAVDRHPSKDELLTGGADGAPKIYKMVREQARQIGDDFNLIRKFDAMPGRVFDVKFSRDGERIVAGSSWNGAGEVRVYNVADGKTLAMASIPEGGVFAVAFSPDGKFIASGGFDGLIRYHDAATGQLLRVFSPAPLAEKVAASP